METEKKDKLIPLTEWPQHHLYPPIGQLRWLVFRAEFNGFSKVIRRIGRRVLISEKAYFEWVDSGQSAQN